MMIIAAILLLVPVPDYVYSFGDKPLYESFIERDAGFFVHSNVSDAFGANILTVLRAEAWMSGIPSRRGLALLALRTRVLPMRQFDRRSRNC